MNGFSLLLCMTLAQMPAIEVATLGGEQYQGTLEAFSANSVIVKTDAKSVSIPIAEVLLVRSPIQAVAPPNETTIEVRLVDLSRLRIRSLTSSANVFNVVHPQFGELRLPIASVANIRLAPFDAKIDGEWTQLLERAIKKDAVAVRKGDVLDHLDGVIGTLNEATLQFQMEGENIAVKREKIFGLIYSKRESSLKKAIAQLDLVSGDRLSIKQIAWAGTVWKAKLVTGLELEIAPELFQTLDFSLGKVMYLSDLEPRAVEYKPYFGPINSFVVNEYRRDKNFDGSRISLGEKSYAKGLAIHSQTLLKYRLGAEYRRFQAVMGIGDEIPFGDVDVVIKGDNKVLFKSAVKANVDGEKQTTQRAAPQLLDIDVASVVELEILVDYGSDNRDIGDRLYLGNARVVK